MSNKNESIEKQVVSKMESPAMEKSLKQVMPEFLDYNRFLQIATRQAKTKLKECKNLDPNSILIAAYEAAKFGLSFDETRGEAYMVPFNTNVGTKKKPQYKTIINFMPGYQGLIKLCRNSGMKKINARIVYENDDFNFWLDDDGDHLEHSPCLNSKEDRGDPIAGYSIAVFDDGTRDIFTLPYDKILEAKKMSKTKKVWEEHEEAMAVKTVIRRHCKMLPKDTILSQATKLDEDREGGKKTQEVPDDLVKAGVVDAEYKDVAEEEEEEEEQSTKPNVDMPKEKTFAMKAKEILPEAQITSILYEDFGYNSLDEVPDKEKEKVLDAFARAKNNGGENA